MDEEERLLGMLLPIAMMRAHYYERMWGQPPGELESAALFGAWDAIKRYKPGMGASLMTYARHRIDGEIIDWHRKERQQRGGSRRENMRKYVFCVDFTDLTTRDSDASLIEKMEQGRTYEKGFSEIDNHDVLQHLKARMDAREWDILIRCVCNEEYMKDVGADYGVSESRICQLLPIALKHARKIIEEMNQSGESCGLDHEDMLEAQWLRRLNENRASGEQRRA
jgi:RNA polymerase sigma factor (sigma-70 family)